MLKNLKNIYIDNHLIYYPTPSNINYFWGAGSMSGIFLGIQILTGVFLAMYYTPHVDYAFISVEHIMRDVQYGWFIRYVHANGASFFFILVYLHIARNLYYGSYIKPRTVLWLSGITILLLMMATAFLGYVLPWGQMSFWGATVITNLFSVIPFIGLTLVEWLWGGFSVNNATLNKFFSLHFLLPFAIVGMVLLHLLLLHKVGSNNPLGIINNKVINFYPYFYIKDLFVFFSIFFLFLIIVCYYPNLFGHPDNYIIANSMVTPAHIVPEWYFLPFYAILRSVPDKLGGVLAMGGSIVLFYFLPLFNCYLIRSTFFKPFYNILYWFFIMNFCLLGWLGQMPVEDPYIFLGQLITFFYFLYFIIIIFINILENVINPNIGSSCKTDNLKYSVILLTSVDANRDIFAGGVNNIFGGRVLFEQPPHGMFEFIMRERMDRVFENADMMQRNVARMLEHLDIANEKRAAIDDKFMDICIQQMTDKQLPVDQQLLDWIIGGSYGVPPAVITDIVCSCGF